jgi:hypothetical protein
MLGSRPTQTKGQKIMKIHIEAEIDEKILEEMVQVPGVTDGPKVLQYADVNVRRIVATVRIQSSKVIKDDGWVGIPADLPFKIVGIEADRS